LLLICVLSAGCDVPFLQRSIDDKHGRSMGAWIFWL
jgi:hypothetical protein